MYYEITYVYDGKEGTKVVYPEKGYEDRFFEYCVDNIDSIVRSGAVVIDTFLHK